MGDGPGAWALCPTQPLNSAQVPGPRTCWGDPMEGTGSGLQALLGGGLVQSVEEGVIIL